MDLKDIQALIRFISSSGVDEVSIERKDFKLNIKKNSRSAVSEVSYQPVSQPRTVEAASRPEPAVVEAPKNEPVPEKATGEKLYEIKSPMIGTFYRSPGPGKSTFVNVGDDIDSGKTVCIIEAMKLYNEIESEVKGKIVKILVEDASPVEYDQPLFLVDLG